MPQDKLKIDFYKTDTEEVLLVDKPVEWTSHDVVSYLKNIFKDKVGHTGTLEPFASGLLIILVGKKNTKRQAEYLKLDKIEFKNT